MAELECICKGNWRLIIHESEPYFGKQYKNNDEIYTFCGVAHCDDDYYYIMLDENGKAVFSTCCASLKRAGYVLIKNINEI